MVYTGLFSYLNHKPTKYTGLFSYLNSEPTNPTVNQPLPIPSLPAKPKKELPGDVWYLILPYLHRPRPAPLSRPLRSELRQPDLCATARVCKLFHEISEKLLYTELFLEGLYHIAQTIDHTGASSNRRFLHTRQLHIDYWETAMDPPYIALAQNTDTDFWPLYGRNRNVVDSTVLWDCSRELGTLTWSLGVFNRYGMSELFHNLVSISVPSIYGKENNRWLEYHEKCPNDKLVKIRECGIAFNTFLMSGNLQSICLRDSNGPLSSHPDYYSSKTPKYSISLHFSELTDWLHAPVDTRVCWASDIPMTGNSAQAFEELVRSDVKLVNARKAASVAGGQGAVDLTIFCSTNSLTVPESRMTAEEVQAVGGGPSTVNLTAKQQRLITADMGVNMQKKLRAAGGTRDTVKWLPSLRTPVCSSCHSGVPGDSYGEWKSGPYAAKGQELAVEGEGGEETAEEVNQKGVGGAGDGGFGAGERLA